MSVCCQRWSAIWAFLFSEQPTYYNGRCFVTCAARDAMLVSSFEVHRSGVSSLGGVCLSSRVSPSISPHLSRFGELHGVMCHWQATANCWRCLYVSIHIMASPTLLFEFYSHDCDFLNFHFISPTKASPTL